jgi:hypothetical protein
VSDSADLVRLEHDGWKALCNGTAADFYAEVMTDDAVMVLANGMVMDRDQVVDALAGSPAWDSYEMSDVRVVPLGSDSAALVYRAEARRMGSDEPVIAVMTSVYVADGDTWRLALYQQTPAAS